MAEKRNTVVVNEPGEFGRWLADAMQAAQVTAEQLKQPPMMTGGYVRLLRQGTRMPSLSRVQVLLQNLGWRITDSRLGGSEDLFIDADPSQSAAAAGMVPARFVRPSKPRRPDEDLTRAIESIGKWAYKERMGSVQVGDHTVALRKRHGRRQLRIKAADGTRVSIDDESEQWASLGVDSIWDRLADTVAFDRIRDGIAGLPPGLWPIVAAANPALVPPGPVPDLPRGHHLRPVIEHIITGASSTRKDP